MTHTICGYSIFSVTRNEDGGGEVQLWGARRHLLRVIEGRVRHESELLGPFRRDAGLAHQFILDSIQSGEGVGEDCSPQRVRPFKFWGSPNEEDRSGMEGVITGHVVDYDPRPRGGNAPPELVPLLCVSLEKDGFGSREVMVRLHRPGHQALKRDADPASQIRATFSEIGHAYRLQSKVSIEPLFRRKANGRPGGYWLLGKESERVVPPTKENLAEMAAVLQGHFSPTPATAK